MATLSTLELMLLEVQNQENIGDHGRMPGLPHRPVSKARIPSRRTRRANLSFHMQELGGKNKKKEEFVDGNGFAFDDGGLVLSKNCGDEKEEHIIGIQRYFRGYQARFHYYKLKEGIITLQSFIRGENARRKLQKWTEMPTHMHVNQEFVWKPLRNRESTIIYLQSVVRAWLSRRHPGYLESAAIENMNDAKDLPNENAESQDHFMVSESYIRDLERQVLRTEAALRHKKRENSILASQIQQIHTKWELHKAQMDSKEKIWQDEFTSIQMNLASNGEKKTNEITHLPQNTSGRQDDGKTDLTIKQILELQESEFGFCMNNMQNSEKFHKQELRKLKGRFKAWKKEFKARLLDIKRTSDRFDDDQRTKRACKSCWVG